MTKQDSINLYQGFLLEETSYLVMIKAMINSILSKRGAIIKEEMLVNIEFVEVDSTYDESSDDRVIK